MLKRYKMKTKIVIFEAKNKSEQPENFAGK